MSMYTQFVRFATVFCVAFLFQGLAARAGESSESAHWAFQPVTRPEPPEVVGEWSAHPIDRFILYALEQRGLSPSDPAERRTLIRRVYLDVLGLPPTPDEVEAFLNDPAPDAYAQLVDRVLASPHYGERWARHWLDVVGFAETQGFEMNNPRPNAWPYRDYVIRAFNEDKPYPEFIREQLAGDALAEDAATGFLVAGAWDQVKSPDVVLTKNQRDAELHDMVSTTSAAFLGVTVGCAKCHEHKFDPVSQRDYYAMRALFQGVLHGDREILTQDKEDRLARAAKVKKAISSVDAKMLGFVRAANVEGLTQGQVIAGPPDSSGALRPQLNFERNVERFAPVRARFVRLTVLKAQGSGPCIDEFEVFSSKAPDTNLALANHGALATASSEILSVDIHKTKHLNDGLYGNNHSWIPAEKDAGWAQIELAESSEFDMVVWGRDREGKFKDRLALQYLLEVAEEPEQWRIVASSYDRATFGDADLKPSLYATDTLDVIAKAEFAGLEAQRAALESAHAELTSFPKVYGGTFEQPGPTHLLYRGDPTQERDPVSPAAPERIGPRLDLPADAPEQDRRLRLADWIASEENPLTARVMVNRIWQHHFGRGIVDTPSDFGAMGALPTHPELLDWLAAEFVAQGWRPKAMHRIILLSRSYRQSSGPRQEALAKDADTRYLWRFPPRRLEAEPVRDSVLAVSGVLDPQMNGPGYSVFKPNDNYVRVYDPKTEFGPEEWRRMVYQFRPRSQPDQTFGVLDCPDGSRTEPRRNVSTTPLQALNLLNSPFMVQQALLLSERLRKEAGETTHAQVDRAFRLAFGRDPVEEEQVAAQRLIHDAGLDIFCRALYNANEFVYLN